MKRLVIFITILTIGCSTEKKQADKDFSDLTQDEKIKLLGQLGEEFKGDFLTYSGQAKIEDSTGLQILDSLVIVELVMDSDNRFAIRTKFIENEIKTDTLTFHFLGGQQSNKGMGEWSDLGDKFEDAAKFIRDKNVFPKDTPENVKEYLIANELVQADHDAMGNPIFLLTFRGRELYRQYYNKKYVNK